MTKCDTESESSCSLVKSRRKALSITRQSPSETLSLSSSDESSSESEDGSKKEVEDAITKIAKTTVKQIDTDMSGFESASAESSNEGSEDQDPTYVDHSEVTIKNEISGKLTNKERENIRVSNKLKLAKLTSIFTPPKSQKKPPPNTLQGTIGTTEQQAYVKALFREETTKRRVQGTSQHQIITKTQRRSCSIEVSNQLGDATSNSN